MAQQKAYFGLSWIISLILAIIPITSLICGVIVRIERKNILGVILNIILFPIFWLIDLITIIIQKDLTVLA